jgi:hypothetical protein
MMTQQRRRAERGDDDTTPGRIVCSRQIRVDPWPLPLALCRTLLQSKTKNVISRLPLVVALDMDPVGHFSPPF